MNASDDFSDLPDPEFLAERKRVREQLEHIPENAVSGILADRYEALNAEFLRRARVAWLGEGQ